MSKTKCGAIARVKKKAKAIKKRFPHVPLMHVQHDLAVRLGFRKWGDLILSDATTIQNRIKEVPEWANL